MKDLLDYDELEDTSFIEEQNNRYVLIARATVCFYYVYSMILMCYNLIQYKEELLKSDYIPRILVILIFPFLFNGAFIYYNYRHGMAERDRLNVPIFRKLSIILCMIYISIQILLSFNVLFRRLTNTYMDLFFFISIVISTCLFIILKREYRYLKRV